MKMRQLDQLNLRQRQGQQEESISTYELQVGQTVELLTKAKHGKAQHSKAKQGKAKQGKVAKRGKAKQSKAAQKKA